MPYEEQEREEGLHSQFLPEFMVFIASSNTFSIGFTGPPGLKRKTKI